MPPEELSLVQMTDSMSGNKDIVVMKDHETVSDLDSDHLYLCESHSIHELHQPRVDHSPTRKRHKDIAISELQEQINSLRDSIKERDVAIETLQRDKDEMEEKIKEMITSQHEIQKKSQTAEQRERTWQDKCHRLQRELDRLKKIETYSDPEVKVQILEAELKEMTEQVNTQEKNKRHIQQIIDKRRGQIGTK